MAVKRGHMVSRSYLREWTDRKGIVDVADLLQGRASTNSIGNATVVSYVYKTNVLNVDLEAEFEKIETTGIPALRRLRECQEHPEEVRDNVIQFLAMHRLRGLYADQADRSTHATLLMSDGSSRQSDLLVGDRMALTHFKEAEDPLTRLGIAEWPWNIWEVGEAVTGDGAVILWRESGEDDTTTITFPLSPTEILVIGRPLKDPPDLNLVTAVKSRRWLVGRRGAFKKAMVPIISRNHRPQPVRWNQVPGTNLEVL